MNTFHRFFVAGLLTCLSSTAVAEQPYQQQPQYQQQPRPRNYGEKVGHKALNGFTNITTSWLEIPKSIVNDYNAEDSNLFYGLIGGLLEGTLNTSARAISGAVDLATAPLPTKPAVYPKYIWDDFDETNTYGDIFRLDSNGQQAKFAPHGQAQGTSYGMSK